MKGTVGSVTRSKAGRAVSISEKYGRTLIGRENEPPNPKSFKYSNVSTGNVGGLVMTGSEGAPYRSVSLNRFISAWFSSSSGMFPLLRLVPHFKGLLGTYHIEHTWATYSLK